MTRCDTSTDGEANLIIGGVFREMETRLSDAVHSWSDRLDSTVRLGRHFYNGLANDAGIVKNFVTQNYENALSTVLGFRMALDFAFNGFGEFTDLFVPFYDGDIEEALSRRNFYVETADLEGQKKSEKNA